MTNPKLLNSLARLGFPLFEPPEALDVNATLAEAVKSDDPRLWEGFPVLLANAVDNFQFSPEQVLAQLPLSKHQQLFRQLTLLSNAVYDSYHLSFPELTKLRKSFSPTELQQVKSWQKNLTNNLPLTGLVDLDSERVKNLFELYFEKKAEQETRRKDKLVEFSLEFALSQVFSPKQKELFRKKLEGAPLSKTETEYYSRTVKKKVVALANSELHNLARKLLEQ